MTKPKTIQILGLVCIISAAIFSANGVWEIMQPSIMVSDQFIILDPLHFRIQMLIFGFLCVLGFFAGQFGYYLRGAAGKNWFSKIVIAISAIGTVLYTSGAVISAVTLAESQLFGLGIVMAVLFCPMLLGLSALFAKVAPIWKRVWPICLLLAPSVLFPLFISNGWPRYGALALNGLFWLVFGYAVFTEGREKPVATAA